MFTFDTTVKTETAISGVLSTVNETFVNCANAAKEQREKTTAHC